MERFLQHMKKVIVKGNESIKDFQWSFGVDEYKQVFSHTKENAACGPSGIHMNHWKAAEETFNKFLHVNYELKASNVNHVHLA